MSVELAEITWSCNAFISILGYPSIVMH